MSINLLGPINYPLRSDFIDCVHSDGKQVSRVLIFLEVLPHSYSSFLATSFIRERYVCNSFELTGGFGLLLLRCASVFVGHLWGFMSLPSVLVSVFLYLYLQYRYVIKSLQ